MVSANRRYVLGVWVMCGWFSLVPMRVVKMHCSEVQWGGVAMQVNMVWEGKNDSGGGVNARLH